MGERLTDDEIRDIGNRLSMLAGSCDFMARQSPNADSWPEYARAARAAAEALSEVTDLRQILARVEEAAADIEHLTRISLPSGAVAVVSSMGLLAEMDSDLLQLEARAERAEAVANLLPDALSGCPASPALFRLLDALATYDAARAENPAADATQGGGAVSGEGEAATGDTQTFARGADGHMVNWLAED